MRRFISFPTLLTLTALLLVAGFWVREQEQDVDLAKEADRIAYNYGVDVTRFHKKIYQAAIKRAGDDPAQIADVIRAQMKNPPVLPEAPGGSREVSAAYRQAERDAVGVLQPYKRAIRDLDRAQVGVNFLKAATAALTAQVANSSGVDVGAVQGALAEFNAAAVPKGAEEAAALVRTALQTVLDQERGSRSASFGGFSFADQYNDAETAVKTYSLKVDAQIEEAFDAINLD